MQNLSVTLHNSDAALLPILAQFWGVDIQNMETHEIITALSAVMEDPARAEKIWNGLDAAQHGALQTLVGSGGKMTTPMFERFFGEIRKMGAGRIEREKPHQNPASVAEALYYRGLIAEAFEQAETGARAIIYIPPELSAALPTHKTGYDAEALGGDIEGLPMEADAKLEPLDDVEEVQPASTALVDDLTTLLAYIQLHAPAIEGDSLIEDDIAALTPHLLAPDRARLAFMLGIARTADLIEIQEGNAYTRRAEVRRWLSDRRAEQVKTLADAWRDSTQYLDLWHVPGLYPEPTGWSYDPVAARKGVLHFIAESAPAQSWWSLDELIDTMKSVDPDFQRPGGDYESWYIRNEAGEYLDGFESWDAVEGATLEFYLQGPLHWLGLVDLAEYAARLTAYGRAFVHDTEWPSPVEKEEVIEVQQDGALLASRRVPRIDRFQLARFSSWKKAGDPYIYQLDADGIQQAALQGITTEHIAAFIKRMLGENPMPIPIVRLLAAWQAGPATAVTMEHLLVLRTTSPDTLDDIWNNPALRRFLGAKLGEMAAVVRADQWEALYNALGELGIQVEVIDTGK